LIVNAMDAMPKGGSLVIETSNCILDAEYKNRNPIVESGEYVKIVVSDNGTGMRVEIKDHMFEPFFTTKPRDKGTGLGMSMVYGFVKRSGGYIKVYSELDIGTTIRIYLPRWNSVEENESIKTYDIPSIPNGKETILVVDDEHDLLSLAEDYLKMLGYTIITANNGKEALEVISDNRGIDLLFSDVVMPVGINGYELAEQAAEIKPDLKVLLTTGFTSKSVSTNGQARFRANILSKPYTQQDLAVSIRKMLDS